MAAKKKPAPKKSIPAPKAEEHVFFMLVHNEGKSYPMENSYGTFSSFDTAQEALESLIENLSETATEDQCELTKAEYSILKCVEVKYDIIPAKEATAKLVEE